MPLAYGGQGTLGLAFEAVYGTLIAVPTKFIPIRSESIAKMEDKVYRTPIRGLADRSAAVQGYFHTEGDIDFEVTSDALIYFLYAARTTITKTGAMAPFTYVFKPGNYGNPTTAATGASVPRTLSIVVDRSNGFFGYNGMSIVNSSYSFDNGLLVCTMSLLGLDEAQVTQPTATFAPMPAYGPGSNVITVGGSARADVDTFSLTIAEGGEALNRIRASRAASYVRWGEREVSGSYDTDFLALADYNAFLAQTSQVLLVTATNNAASDQVALQVNSGITDSYAANLASLGDLTRVSVSYHGVYGGGTPEVYTITVKTNESVT